MALGRRCDSNSAVIARALATLGLEPCQRACLRADVEELTRFLRDSAQHFALLVVSGGREGPAPPTVEAMRRWAGETAEELPNPVGPTPGFRVERDGALACFLPGAAPEMEAVLEQHVLPAVAARAGNASLGFHAIRVFSPSGTDMRRGIPAG